MVRGWRGGLQRVRECGPGQRAPVGPAAVQPCPGRATPTSAGLGGPAARRDAAHGRVRLVQPVRRGKRRPARQPLLLQLSPRHRARVCARANHRARGAGALRVADGGGGHAARALGLKSRLQNAQPLAQQRPVQGSGLASSVEHVARKVLRQARLRNIGGGGDPLRLAPGQRRRQMLPQTALEQVPQLHDLPAAAMGISPRRSLTAAD
eukprot:scaffold19485_cov84-Isochrysis_galbana.AAC.1